MSAEGSARQEIPRSLVTALREAGHVVALTGAGISAESGIPTFRDAQTGLWAQYDPQELATPQAYRRDPALVWEWYSWRRQLLGKAAPNPGHYALAALEKQVPRFTLITQNIDELHQAAGSRNAIELHGSIRRSKCMAAGHLTREWESGEPIPPLCTRCGSPLRPDVVWFGEGLPHAALEAALIASRAADLFFTIGTSAVVYPAAALPLEAVEHGAITVEINPEATPVTRWMDYVLQEPAGVVLPRLVAAAWPAMLLPGEENGEQ